MRLNKLLMIRTVYIICFVNILLTLLVSSFVLSLRGSNEGIIFFPENNSEFLISLFLAFVLFYPLLFFLIYLLAFIVQLLINDGPAEI